MARKVRQIRRKGKAIGIVPVPKAAAPEVDARVALIQALIPVALDRVYEELKAEVERLMRQLTPHERRLLRLSFGLGLDAHELARLLGDAKPESLRRARLRAITRLRALLAGER